MDFLELRAYYDQRFKPEGPGAGFAEFRQLRASRAWPGHSRIYEDLAAREASGFWNRGFAPGLARYLRERTWLAPHKPIAPSGAAVSTAAPADDAVEWAEAARRVRAREARLRAAATGTAAVGTSAAGPAGNMAAVGAVEKPPSVQGAAAPKALARSSAGSGGPAAAGAAL